MFAMRSIQAARAGCATSARRAFATQAKIKLHGLSGRYAGALYNVAASNNVLDRVEKDLGAFTSLREKNDEFDQFVLNPVIARGTKASALDAILEQNGAHKTTRDFFGVVAENGRLTDVDKIIKDFEKMTEADRDEVAVKVITATKMTNAQLKKITQVLKAKDSFKGNLTIENEVDPEIVGGMIVQTDDLNIDASVKTKLMRTK